MPKIKVMVNEYGQPVGENARRFSGAIGVHVRWKISIACADWRLVNEDLKDAVWLEMKEYFDIDDEARDWVLDAAGKKWKDFKANLKRQFFKGEITEEKLRTKQGKRLNDDDWNFLKNHWSKPESAEQAEIAKANRAKLSIHHTTGSKSFACNRHELANELGRPPRRDELYIKTHTRKNGIPSSNAEPIINKLKAVIEAQPELTEKSIQEGDAFAAACGKKEPKGRVRGLGLGPTPQTVGTPGAKGYTATRVQMLIRECKRKESCQAALESHKTALEQRVAELEAELARERLAHERSSMENVSQNGSNSRHHEIGKETVLYALQRDEPVAKGTIISVNPKSMHAGQALGKKHCPVVVKYVMKRDAKLPHPYPGVEVMAGAKDMTIAWPYKRLKVGKPKKPSCGTDGGKK